MIVLPQQGGDRAVHHGHCGRDEEAEDVDGSEEGTVCLCCQVSQVSCCKYNINVSHLFLSFIVSTEKGRYYEGEKEDEEEEYYEV